MAGRSKKKPLSRRQGLARYLRELEVVDYRLIISIVFLCVFGLWVLVLFVWGVFLCLWVLLWGFLGYVVLVFSFCWVVLVLICFRAAMVFILR